MARLSRQLICDLFLSRLDSLLDQNEGIIDVLDTYFVGFLSYPFLLRNLRFLSNNWTMNFEIRTAW